MIKALRCYDDELGEQPDESADNQAGKATATTPKIHLDLPAGSAATRPCIRRAPRRQTTASWEFWFGPLERYLQRTGPLRLTATTRWMAIGAGA
jgi:hypothetical protein